MKPLLSLLLSLTPSLMFAELNPAALTALLDRVGGEGTAARFVTEVSPALADSGRETFVIGQRDGKPYVGGSTLSAATRGIGHYLSHQAHQQVSWNSLRLHLADAPLPLPCCDVAYHTAAPLRYYLNYCTFSYTTAFWTWERWQQEIDWMALHGVNMPLQLVGTETVWRNVLLRLGYTPDEAARFIAGPAFLAWFLMGNLEGWGGPNPEGWYAERERVARQILQRERELGMTPVLPGYAGMVPSDFLRRQGRDRDAGGWCGFTRPGFLLPTDSLFPRVAQIYYEELERLMGRSEFYSMDLFHEGGNTQGVDLRAAFLGTFDAMRRAAPDSRWVLQAWGENPRRECLEAVPKGGLLVLDLFADGEPRYPDGAFLGHDFIYCIIHNFGGRTGLHGRLQTTLDGYYDAQTRPNCVGIGAAPEGSETNPVCYELLYESAWERVADLDQWLSDYATARYGDHTALADSAWRLLARSVYACPDNRQGTSEPVVCARPALQVKSVSTWSRADIYWNTGFVRRAAAYLLGERKALGRNPGYQYDVVDLVRQCLTDEAHARLGRLNEAAAQGTGTNAFRVAAKDYMEVIADLDRLLSTHPAFMLGTWLDQARRAADDIPGATDADRRLFDRNARLLVTTWGHERAANQGGLRDYSNREWGGLLETFYAPRWARFFQSLADGTTAPGAHEWYEQEAAWVDDATAHPPVRPQGNPVQTAARLFSKYFGAI
ncbi:MAG: alpha-N-acetylglucosaminidase [Bacteroidaceae bacterium]|nr:alpha-N-acetylglucosaminidase [Bacteroidaceae bacterium]